MTQIRIPQYTYKTRMAEAYSRLPNLDIARTKFSLKDFQSISEMCMLRAVQADGIGTTLEYFSDIDPHAIDCFMHYVNGMQDIMKKHKDDLYLARSLRDGLIRDMVKMAEDGDSVALYLMFTGILTMIGKKGEDDYVLVMATLWGDVALKYNAILACGLLIEVLEKERAPMREIAYAVCIAKQASPLIPYEVQEPIWNYIDELLDEKDNGVYGYLQEIKNFDTDTPRSTLVDYQNASLSARDYFTYISLTMYCQSKHILVDSGNMKACFELLDIPHFYYAYSNEYDPTKNSVSMEQLLFECTKATGMLNGHLCELTKQSWMKTLFNFYVKYLDCNFLPGFTTYYTIVGKREIYDGKANHLIDISLLYQYIGLKTGDQSVIDRANRLLSNLKQELFGLGLSCNDKFTSPKTDIERIRAAFLFDEYRTNDKVVFSVIDDIIDKKSQTTSHYSGNLFDFDVTVTVEQTDDEDDDDSFDCDLATAQDNANGTILNVTSNYISIKQDLRATACGYVFDTIWLYKGTINDNFSFNKMNITGTSNAIRRGFFMMASSDETQLDVEGSFSFNGAKKDFYMNLVVNKPYDYTSRHNSVTIDVLDKKAKGDIVEMTVRISLTDVEY